MTGAGAVVVTGAAEAGGVVAVGDEVAPVRAEGDADALAAALGVD